MESPESSVMSGATAASSGVWLLPEDCEPEEYQNVEQGAEILHHLNAARKEGRFCDVIMTLDDESELRAHRVVIMAASETLCDRLGLLGEEAAGGEAEAAVQEEVVKRVEVKDIPADIMKALVEYIYTGEVEITRHNVKDMLETSTVLRMPHLKHSCFNFIAENLRPENALVILDYAFQRGPHMHALYDAIKKYCLRFFALSVEYDSFLAISEPVMRELIRDDELMIVYNNLLTSTAHQEKIVASAIIRYIQHSPESRMQLLPEFLSYIRLPFLAYGDLEDLSLTVKRMGVNRKVLRMFKKAKVALFALRNQDRRQVESRSSSSSSSDEEDDFEEAYTERWMTPRYIPDVRILPGAEFGHGRNAAPLDTFDDLDHHDGYVSGVKVVVGENDGKPHIAGLTLLYDDGAELVHGAVEGTEVHDVKLEPGERIVRLILGADVTLQSIGFITNLGQQLGPYGREVGDGNDMVVESPPDGTWGYLAWARGAILGPAPVEGDEEATGATAAAPESGPRGLFRMQFFWAHYPVTSDGYGYPDPDGEGDPNCSQQ